MNWFVNGWNGQNWWYVKWLSLGLVWTEVLYLTTRDTGAAVPSRGTDRPGRRVYRAHWRTGVTTDGLDLDGLT